VKRPPRIKALGVERFGQTGTIADLYRHHGIDTNAILHVAKAVSGGRGLRYRRDLASGPG
jgi:pyruvate dehydrogenase E1 component